MKSRRLVDLLQDAGHRLVVGDRRARLLGLGLLLAASAVIAWTLAQAWSDRAVKTARAEAACEPGTVSGAIAPSPGRAPGATPAAQGPATEAAPGEARSRPTC